MNPEIIITADGSHSLYVKDLNENYHSVNGAIQESNHVFVNAGLKHQLSNSVSERFYKTKKIEILEIGLGTGLNALLTFLETKKLDIDIYYNAMEAYPLKLELANQLNYIQCLKAEKHQTFFDAIHTSEWNQQISLSERFKFLKLKSELKNITITDSFDLIYFDAFAPDVQPEMWTEEVFLKLANVTKPNGSLVTYCAKGEVKRTLKKVGYTVESLPGPPGKREMIRAIMKL